MVNQDFVNESVEAEKVSIYNQSVNSYIAVKEDGTVKWKGVVANPWRTGDGFKPDLRGQLMKNPQMTILANAVVDLITKGVPVEETIRESRDVREFVTVVQVQGGGTWRGEWLGLEQRAPRGFATAFAGQPRLDRQVALFLQPRHHLGIARGLHLAIEHLATGVEGFVAVEGHGWSVWVLVCGSCNGK